MDELHWDVQLDTADSIPLQQAPSNMSQPGYLPLDQGPRVIVYYQTHHKPGTNQPVGLLPLLHNNTGITHVIIAAIHINEPAGNVTLNDDPPEAEKNNALWSDVAWMQAAGVKVMAMLGGAAQGSYAKLQKDV